MLSDIVNAKWFGILIYGKPFGAGCSLLFEYQREKRQESERRIVSALGGAERTFTDLQRMTGLSKSVLAEHLRRMEKYGMVRRFLPSKGKRHRYKLLAGATIHGHIQRTLFSYLSTQVFNDLFIALEDGSIPNKVFFESFSKKIGVVAMYTLLIGLERARDDPDESGKWFEEAFGDLIQKYSWRRCFYRQIFGGAYDLKHPVNLKEPVMPEVKDELIRLPEAFEPGLTGRLHHELPQIPAGRIRQFKTDLHEAYPEDTGTLDFALTLTTEEG